MRISKYLTTEDGMTRSYIWSIPTRVFHWLLVGFISVAFVTSDFENLLTYHVAFGYGVGVLIVFRFVWGFMGEKYVRFSSFKLNIAQAKEFSLNLLTHKKYPSHNPAASFVVIAILIITSLLVLSGALAYGVQEARGIFSYLNDSFFKQMDIFEELHEILFNILALLVVVHISGVAVEYILNREDGVVSSIFTGYKNFKADDSNLNIIQKTTAVVFLSLAISIVYYTITSDSILTKSGYSKIDYEAKSELFVSECASCHILYPPHLLPKESWKKMMGSLQDHFGDDASLDEEDRVAIERFLVENAAQNSKKESSVYILKSLKDYDTIAITDTPYWKKRHKDIKKELFLSKRIKSKANCKACHTNIEYGLINDRDIKDFR